MKNKKEFILILLLFVMLVYFYLENFTNVLNNKISSNIVLVFIIILGLYAIKTLLFKDNYSIKGESKLFNSLVENADTVYIMINDKNKEVIYLSKNISEVLGIDYNKNKNEILYQILNIPVIKSELDSWDRNTKYVSQMIEYDNPKYNYQMWIKVKIFPFEDKNNKYYIIEVLDATKDHERQHLLISQASDIKSREIQLNQITAASYDVEIDINVVNNSYDLKYFKFDNMYFGEARKGNYNEGLKEILSYINDGDKDEVYNKLCIKNLKEHFEKYELDSFTVRYRIGNEIKNNTWLESTVFFLSKQNNRVSILTKNVTENAESIREQNVLLQNALNDTRIASKAKSDLIQTISHDIRTPLTNIMGLSETILNKKIPEDIKEDINNINISSNEVLDIIDGLIDTKNIEKALIKKEEKQYSILKMFKKIETSSKEYLGNKAIKLNFNLDKNLPVVLFGDYKRITQAILNIINNSIKYTDEGEINVNVRGEKKDKFVNLTVEVADTGIGIEEKKLEKIMNSDGNTGIGTVKKFVELLDGKLEIESKVGEYTKVTISFVQKILEDNKVRTMIDNNKNALEFDLTGKRVLIVDDNKLNLKVTSRLLEPYHLETVLLESGEECIDYIKEQNNFDLIMLDQMMPGLDGMTTLSKLKEMPGFNTPVVVLTADVVSGQKEKYLNHGFEDYISKPIDKKELSRVLKKFVKDNNN